MPEPTYEELKARLAKLEKIAQKNVGQPRLGVDHNVGNLLIHWPVAGRRPLVFEVPNDVVNWIFANAKTVAEFQTANSGLLTSFSDDAQTLTIKQQAREENLKSLSPVVRKPITRKEKTEEGAFD
jgi:hypothetical protein